MSAECPEDQPMRGRQENVAEFERNHRETIGNCDLTRKHMDFMGFVVADL